MRPYDETDDRRLSDFLASRVAPSDEELEQIEAALYLEETFHISLSDEEISPDTVGSPESIRRFLHKKLGG